MLIFLLIINYFIATMFIFDCKGFTLKEVLILLIPFVSLILIIGCLIYIIVEDIYYDYFWRQK